ncbi:MAG TPA: hypothetical protein VMJ10_12070, partial [Kofleriaceae bacterium]|nr:hypothetical protein [Kofleriaceae bacterium]
PRVWDVDAASPGAALAIADYRAIGFGDGGRAVVLDTARTDEVVHTVAIFDSDTGLLAHAIADSQALPAISANGGAVTTVLASHRVVTWTFADGVETALSGPVQQAELDPSGRLLAGIDVAGEAVLVLDATDNRLLARWAIAHDPPTIGFTQDRFGYPRGSASWSRDGTAIVTRSRRLAVWNADTELPAQLAPLVHCNVPWQVEDGRLVPAVARMHGRVVAGVHPVAGATIDVEYRRPPDLGLEVTWQLRESRTERWHLRADGDGGFAQDRLAPGEYTLAVHGGAATVTVPATVTMEDEELVIDLAGTRARSP